MVIDWGIVLESASLGKYCTQVLSTHMQDFSLCLGTTVVAWKQVYNAVASLIHKLPEQQQHLRDDDDDLCIFALPVHVPIPLAFLRR